MFRHRNRLDRGNFIDFRGYGATDGARTRDNPDHNQVLYQLSYGRHVVNYELSSLMLYCSVGQVF